LAVVGVPLTVADGVPELRDSPGGNVPESSVQVYGVDPPEAVTDWL